MIFPLFMTRPFYPEGIRRIGREGARVRGVLGFDMSFLCVYKANSYLAIGPLKNRTMTLP
jgi:hypothetical protein